MGSFPSGYLISRFSTGQNVLAIGWRKSSGSNVFNNVGKWQGILTAFFDITKGFLAVFLAQKIGLSLEVQILAGLAALVGHNWSCFLKFSGGRGIGTFGGALLAFSPQLFLIAILILLTLALIWNAAIGTILFLASVIYFSSYYAKFETAGIFTILSLFPIFIKRLSPIKEIFRSDKWFALFFNRLTFDDDEATGFRIKRIIKKAKENPEKISYALRFAATPITASSKAGWRAAKFGVKMARKPIEMLVGKNSEKVIFEIGIAEIRSMLTSSAKSIVRHQEEINRINVFPIADKDTGYNLAATLLGIEGAISDKEYSSILELATDIKTAAMVNARGNSGMILAGWLMRFMDEIKSLDTVDGLHLGIAMRRAINSAYSTISEPVEGTILDVIKASGRKAYEEAKLKNPKEKNIIKILQASLKVSQKALAETKEKLEVLKQNDVVDAGALGFVKILESWIFSLKGIEQNSDNHDIKSFAFCPKPDEKAEYRYEVVFTIKKNEGFDAEKFRKELAVHGGSIEILCDEDDTKVHIHTNNEEAVKEFAKVFEIMDWRVEDLVFESLENAAKKPIGLIVGETADLPEEILQQYQIEKVAFRVVFPEGEKNTSGNLYDRIATAKKLPVTAAATFNDYFSVFKKALERYEKIIVITLPSKISGAYSQARIARSLFGKPIKYNIYVFDCLTTEVAEGLIATKAQQMISDGKDFNEVIDSLKVFCGNVELLGCIEDYKYLAHSGRVRIPRPMTPLMHLMQKMGARLLFGLKEGRVKFIGIRFGKDITEILAEEIREKSEGKQMIAAIGHADNIESAEHLKNKLEKMGNIEVLFISEVSPVVGVHVGRGTLIVGFYPKN